MLEVAPATESGESGDAADLAVFVDRLAAAGSDRPTAQARVQIRRAIGEGSAPPGVRRLAEALAASVDHGAPTRRVETADSIAAAMRTNTLAVLEELDAYAVAGTIDALLADGKRIIVTGPNPRTVDELRRALPPHTAGRLLDDLPAMGPGELRELRGLLATSTPARRARARQELPDIADLPAPLEVDELCRQHGRSAEPGPGASMVPRLLSELDPGRRAAVTSVAHLVDRSLSALPAHGECPWAWRLLSDLVLSQHRADFDGMLEDTSQAVAAVEAGRDAEPVVLQAPPDPTHLSLMRQYRDYLTEGGRCRTYFRSSLQREAQPVLGRIRVGGRVPVTAAEVSRVVEYLELGEWLRRVCSGCAKLHLPPPRDDRELRVLNDMLLRVAAAARSVSALRHDVLFLAEDSPLSVPDVDSAAQVAAAILEFELYGSAAEAARALHTLADRLMGHHLDSTVAPEHERACRALRSGDAEGYRAAVDALVAARREQHDELRRMTLLQQLAAVAPGLATAWTALADRDPAALGMAVFLPMDRLLSDIPPPDSADVVLVLGAATLGVEHLLLTAVAPRMIAAVGPGERVGATPTLLSVLRRADALVIRDEVEAPAPAASVVPISTAAQTRPGRVSAMGQAGA